MPYGEPDPGDPNVLVGVGVPAEAETVREMAYVFAEEFARLGFNEARLLRLFRSPFYAGLHHAYRVLGEAAVSEIISECVRVWGPRRLTNPDDGAREGA